MSKLIIVGAGGFGFEVALIADALLLSGTANFDSYEFIDDDASYAAERGLESSVVGTLEGHNVEPGAQYICAIGNPLNRRSVCTKLTRDGAKFVNLIHPSAVVSARARLGTGIIVCAHGFVSCFVTLGNHVHINVASSIGHDAQLDDFVTLSAHVDLTGNVKVGEGAFFGTHAAVLPGHSIGAWARIGAGCTIPRSVANEAIVYTEPPKFLSRGKAT